MLDALNSLKVCALFYAGLKLRLPDGWYKLTEPICRDPDFVSVDNVMLAEIQKQKIWMELKIFRLYQAIFTDSLNDFRGACYMVAIHTREMAEQALKCQRSEIVYLAIKFFNTYLRAVINARDIRTGYNIIKQYRLIAEAALQHQDEAVVLEIAQYFRYYSLTAYKAGLLFLTETFAFDLLLLAQSCCKAKSTMNQNILEIFLRIDQDAESEQQESTLRGVRKSQAKLAAFYLMCGDLPLARIIYQDMNNEPNTRLKIIQDELQSSRPDFWEFTDRGEDFYYVEPSLRPFLMEFFSWFDISPTSQYPSKEGQLNLAPN